MGALRARAKLNFSKETRLTAQLKANAAKTQRSASTATRRRQLICMCVSIARQQQRRQRRLRTDASICIDTRDPSDSWLDEGGAYADRALDKQEIDQEHGYIAVKSKSIELLRGV